VQETGMIVPSEPGKRAESKAKKISRCALRA
jgi:hypothetical protein